MANQFVQVDLEQAPHRAELGSQQGRWLATPTYGAQTVVSDGPRRTFAEGDLDVERSTWVRALPLPFDGEIDAEWMHQALAANAERRPDLTAALGLQAPWAVETVELNTTKHRIDFEVRCKASRT